MKKNAFTLAEVLITLGVIGVVAAITMPTIIKNYQKQMFANKVKYTYTLLANVYERSKLDNGEFSTWDIGTQKDVSENALSTYSSQSLEEIEAIVEKYFAPYLKIVKRTKNNSGCHLVIANGITLSFFTDGSTDANKIYTPKSIYIIASNNNNTGTYGSTSRDYSKHDIFIKIGDNKLGFFKEGNYKTNTRLGCNTNITKNLRYNCSGWIMQNGWKIPDDYPW